MVHSLLHTNWSNREVDTYFTDTNSRFAWQNAEGQALRHAWVIIIKTHEDINKLKAKSDTDVWASDWKLEKCGWVCRGERGQTPKKAGSGHFELLSKSKKDESSPWHQPNSLFRSLTCRSLTNTHSHTTEEHQGRIHEWPVHPGPWCAINEWQPAYWSNKNNGLKRNKNKKKITTVHQSSGRYQGQLTSIFWDVDWSTNVARVTRKTKRNKNYKMTVSFHSNFSLP